MKAGLKRKLVLSVSIVLFILIIVVLDESVEESSNEFGTLSAAALPVVSYIVASPSDQPLSIPVYGELQPKWDVLVKSQVSGLVSQIKTNFALGAKVTSDQLLLELDRTRFIAELNQALVFLEQATLDYLQAEQRTNLARADWERSNLETLPTDLMLFKPQLSIAKSSIQSAESQLSVAKKKLNDTDIKAPFSGVLVELFVGKGEFVTEGDPLFRIVDDQSLLLEVALGEEQWQNLTESWQEKIVGMYSSQNTLLGRARLKRGGDVIDQGTRQYHLYLEISSDIRGQAKSGQFVNLNLPGKNLTQVLNLPESALSEDGTIWVIDTHDVLREYTPEQVFNLADRVLVTPPSSMANVPDQNLKIASQPLAFFLSGKRVSPLLNKSVAVQ